MKYILNNPENHFETEEYLCNETTNTYYKIKSVENKTLYGYSMRIDVVPTSELDGEGLYVWGQISKPNEEAVVSGYIKIEVEVGEKCSEEIIQEIKTKLEIPDDTEMDASSCTCTYDGVIYSYILSAVHKGKTEHVLHVLCNPDTKNMEGLYIANSETAVYTGTYILEGASAVTITTNNGRLAFDEDENAYSFFTIQSGNLINVPAHDEIYSSRNLPGYFKYLGNGKYASLTPSGSVCDGIFREEGSAIRISFGTSQNHGDYIYHDLLFDSGDSNREEITVIGKNGEEITVNARKLIINFDGEYLKCAIAYYTYPSESSYQYFFTGTTWSNLTHYDNFYNEYIFDYHMTKFGAEGQNNVIYQPVPGVAYDRETKAVYYNKSGIEICSIDLGKVIYIIKNRTWDFTTAFNDYINSIYDLQCGGYDLSKDAISKVYGDGEDITNIIMQQDTFLSLPTLSYRVRVGTSWEWKNFTKITVEFTEEFFNGGRIYTKSEECMG